MNVDPLGTERQGWLTRLLGRSRKLTSLNMNVRRRESLSLTVPTAHADAVLAAVERWFADQGVTAPLTTEDEGNGKTRIKAALGEDDTNKLDLSDEQVQSKLQDILEAAVSSSASSS